MFILKDLCIVIIGVGLVGLVVGMYFEQVGFYDYMILECIDYVGGKCYLLNYYGCCYEMGVIMGVFSYDIIQEIMDCIGDKVDGLKLCCEFLYEDGEIYVLEKDLVCGLQVMVVVQKLGQLFVMKYQGYDVNGYYNKVYEDFMLFFDEFFVFNGCEVV